MPALLCVAKPPALAGQWPTTSPLYIATSQNLVEAMLDLAQVREGDVVYDLGSGDGRIVIAAAERGATGIGVEYDESLVRLSRANAESAGVSQRVSFRNEDLFATDFEDASVVTLYLGADFNLRLRPRLLATLAPGTRIVSHAFHMGDWEPDSVRTIGTGAARATIYSWIIPADVDGFWVLEIDGLEGVGLELHQRFQQLTGAVRRGTRETLVEGGSMAGPEIRFRVSDTVDRRELEFHFTGSLLDGRMSGVVVGPPDWGNRQWRALRFSDPLLAPE